MGKLIILFFVSLLLLNFNCKKDPTKNAVLPPATQEGKNTVGFTVNGEVWVPYYKCGFGKDPCGEYSASYSTPSAAPNAISFQVERERGNKSSALTISSSGIGTITSGGDKIDSINVIFNSENSSGNTGYFTGPLTGSKFIITKIDNSTQIISGEFEFILLEQNGSGNTISVRDGRFDFKFNACKCSN